MLLIIILVLCVFVSAAAGVATSGIIMILIMEEKIKALKNAGTLFLAVSISVPGWIVGFIVFIAMLIKALHYV